jgi:hypothetical protein
MIRESGIPSGLEIGGGVIPFCTPYIFWMAMSLSITDLNQTTAFKDI